VELPAKPRFANKLIRNLMAATRMRITKEGPGFFELPLAVWLILYSVTGFWQAGSPPVAQWMNSRLRLMAFRKSPLLHDVSPLHDVPHSEKRENRFTEILQAGENLKPAGLTLLVNRALNRFGLLSGNAVGADAAGLVEITPGLDVGDAQGLGKAVPHNAASTPNAILIWPAWLAPLISRRRQCWRGFA